MTEQAMAIMNYACTEHYAPDSLRAFYPFTTTDDGKAVPDTTDPDEGTVAILIAPVTPDGYGMEGTVRVLLPSGVRVVPSVTVGVWIRAV